MSVKFNIEPYFDDFETATSDGLSPKEKYHKILFRPSHAVQARELTQIQSTLQNQVTQMGNHLFKEGAMVIPGHVSASTKVDYIRISSKSGISDTTFLTDLVGKVFTATNSGATAATTGLEAMVVAVSATDGTDPDTVYLQYLNSGTGNEQLFVKAETIRNASAGMSMVVENVAGTDATGFGSVAFLQTGIYFIKGNFVVVQTDQLVLSKYGQTPTFDVGLKITESIETSAEDDSLNDNANGTPNYAAPGAHRYQIKTKLITKDIGVDIAGTDDDFVLLIQIDTGIIIKEVRTTEYNIVEQTLARRTFDESGNYTVRHFPIDITDHASDSAKLSVGLEPSKAYVQGYEIETLSTIVTDMDRAREAALFSAASLPVNIGNYIDINNMQGMPDLSTFGDTQIFNNVVASQGSATQLGTVRIRSIEKITAAVASPAATAVYRIWMFDIKMISGKKFEDAKSFKHIDTPEFKADIVLDLVGVPGVVTPAQRAIIKDPTRSTLIFKMPFQRVKTCDSQTVAGQASNFNYIYHTMKEIGTSSVAAGKAVFETIPSIGNDVQETFHAFDSREWILTQTTTGTGSGVEIPIASGDLTFSNQNQRVEIGNLTSFNGKTVKLIGGTQRVVKHKTKSLKDAQGNDNHNSFSFDPNTVSDKTADIQLQHADGYELLAVYMAADFTVDAVNTDTDVKENYYLDGGQRDNFYDISKLKLNVGSAFVPTGRLLIKYAFFTHGAGDFFSVDSYTGVVAYENIPTFQSPNNGNIIELSAAIDFRPRMKDGGVGFDGTGAVLAVCPKTSSTFTTDIQYYLNRIDKLFIDSKGEIGIIKGVSAIEPELPDSPKEAMILYHLAVRAYTIDPTEVDITLIDNKRYTMRDIGKLEKRIDGLEYYTSLSLLEAEASNKDVFDTNGLNRLKSGFLVDSFNTHSGGNVLSPEYRVSMDRTNHRMRPLFAEKNAQLKFDALNTNNTNVTKTGDIITLPYAEEQLFNQNKASGQINVNPYEVFDWTGAIELSPSTDEWRDTVTRPQVMVNQTGIYDAMMSIVNATDAMGTNWNSWETNWTGVDASAVTTGGGNWSRTTTTTVTTREQSRTGIETFNAPDTMLTNLGDRVVEVNFSPFTRSRYVSFKATRLRPNTVMHAFLDNVNISPWTREDTTQVDFTGTEVQIAAQMTTNYGATAAGTGDAAHPQGATALKTNGSGEIIGSFWVPNTDKAGSNADQTVRFKTGTRIFRLTDNSSNDKSLETTYASTSYIAKGLIETKENVTISTRVPMLEQRQVFEDRVVVNTSVTSATRWWDPLAQSFLLDIEKHPYGAFITSLDLFFHTKSATVPVTVQIREMNQGLPTPTVVPFSEVTLLPNAVNVVDLTTSNPDPTKVTKFTFPSPVYLQSGQEYCFVVMANSTDYEAWFAEIGGDDFTSGKRISKQPYAGVMFKSQNASTWTPDQNKDLKFQINRAKFTINANSSVVLENAALPSIRLGKSSLRTESGSKEIRVFQKNHGFMETVGGVQSDVTISGVEGAGTPPLMNGIPITEINKIHTVSKVQQDSYVITVATTNATGTGIAGGVNAYATENHIFNVFYPSVSQLNFSVTNTTWGVRLASGASLGNISVSPYAVASSYDPIIVNRNFSVFDPKVIASPDNSNLKTFSLRGALTSSSDYVSPVIDLERCSVINIQNRIDNPVASNPSAGENIVENFIAETAAKGGSVLTKYLTKNVKLKDTSDEIRLFLDMNRPSNTFIDVYYRSHTDDEVIDTLSWVLASPLEQVPFSDNTEEFIESEFVIAPGTDFSVFAIKVVLRTTNSSRVPTCKDLRAIAVKT